MGSPSDFSQLLFHFVYRIFEVCETVVFIALILFLTFLTLRHLLKLARKENA